MIWRAVKGSFVGAIVVGSFAAVLIVLIFYLPIVVMKPAPIERSDAMQGFRSAIVLATVAGILVGGIAGFATGVSKKPVPLLRSVGIVAFCAAIGTRFDFLLGALIGAIVGGMLVALGVQLGDAC